MNDSFTRSFRPGLLPCLMLAALVIAWSGFQTFTPDDPSGHDLVSLFEVTPEVEQVGQPGTDADSGALPAWLAAVAAPVWARTPTARGSLELRPHRPLRHFLCVYRL